MNRHRARTKAEVTNFVIGCEQASRLEREIHTTISLDRLELRLREAIGAVKRVRDSGLGNKRLHRQLSSFEKFCKSLLGTIVGHQH